MEVETTEAENPFSSLFSLFLGLQDGFIALRTLFNCRFILMDAYFYIFPV